MNTLHSIMISFFPLTLCQRDASMPCAPVLPVILYGILSCAHTNTSQLSSICHATGRCLGCFQFLAIINNAIYEHFVHIFWGKIILLSCGYKYVWKWLLVHRVRLYLALGEYQRVLPKWSYQFTFYQKCVRVLIMPHFSDTIKVISL